MSPVPGETGGDCERCGETTTLVGTGNGVIGNWCKECDLVALIAYHDVYLMASNQVWEPEDDDAEDSRPDR